ncbi:SusC/RagA family TonB-linked outer membrane protein [Flavivirga eckloniae]|uniref:SusC/RagA family TonB-linked outer membrane protein n=1 Tax=Flavivirga eckloniae TaxID=1803846 RepID=A0A2K9PMI7_9FLAO|nr:SusC/RagA family TonB-linked outer membrane protein [Flavivirga eckloniae]AUP78283.1 SusC/RagA family TonB-linked outer membrane protein [Flavivirga eckloniae]
MTTRFNEIKLKHTKYVLLIITVFAFCNSVIGLPSKYHISQNDKIVIKKDASVSLDEVFEIVKKQTNYMFVYHHSLFKDFPDINLRKGVFSLKKLLSHVLTGKNVSVVFSTNNTILIKEKINNLKRQQFSVSGIVTDESGVPISGVTVLIKVANKGTITDFDGQYTISVTDSANVLVFSYLGYKEQEIVVGNQTIINVTLKEEIDQLKAITINAGYYNTNERERTGSISKIDAKNIEKQPVNNPLAAMQGHLPGVNITQSTGLPGGGFRVRIRGQNFIDINKGGSNGSTNDPLYVVDGIPYDSSTLESTAVGDQIINSRGVSPLNAINPTDIESIEVLKDADATAIYGSRGANGVILISTKKGKEGKTQIKFNVSTTLGQVANFIELLNTEQYLEIRNETFVNDGYTLETLPDLYSSQVRDLNFWDQSRYTDWQKVLLGGTAYRQNAQLSFSRGNKQTQFLLSGGYLVETTVFPGDSKYSKASMRVNINHQSEDSRFKLNFSGSYNADINNLPTIDFTGNARRLAPIAPVLYDDQGNLNWENLTFQNPLALLETKYRANSRGLIANTTSSYQPIPQKLEFKVNLGYTNYNLDSYKAEPHTALNPGIAFYDSRHSNIVINNGVRESWIVEPQINWQYDGENTVLKLLVGATFQHTKEQQLVLYGKGFPSNDVLLDISQADVRSTVQDIVSEYKYQSFFSRININYRDKYILNLTGRRDGSSRFGPGKQFGYFGAIGSAWLFSEETFLEDNNILIFGKLRASYGITGSDNIGNYNFFDTYEYKLNGIYNGLSLAPTRLFNPDFAWEETKKLEVALELGFFKKRILLSTAWYRNRSSNQLINMPLPAITGFVGVNSNFDAIVENTGIEIDLNTINIQNDHFTWSTTFNISANRNKLVSFPGLKGSTFQSRLVIGQPLIVSQLYHFIGVNQETGMAQFEDYNNDGFLDFNDRRRFEDLTPKYFGGLGNTFQYKNLQLEMFFQFTKQKAFSYLSRVTYPGRSVSNLPVSVLNRWQQVGDISPIQRYSITDNNVFDAWDDYKRSDAAIVDASFIRLRNVSLSYIIPKTVTKEVDLSIYLQGQNLFTFTSYDGADPDVQVSNKFPTLRQFTLGLSLSF